MPPIRTMPTVKPVRTERTHEENQERAYIAASRRSDRSLEARVESARRASEIHKKRTGRSLRVREEDVMNEEMYEEEDDDLPMQFRRINALHPGLAFNNPAFNERVNNYLAGQIGVRNYLHQAIFQANQSQYANQFLNPMMQSNNYQAGTMSPSAMNGAFNNNGQTQQPSWANMQNVRPGSHGRSASIATPQGYGQDNQQAHSNSPKPATPATYDARRPSLPVQNSTSQPPTPHAQQTQTQSPQQMPTPPGRVPAASPPTSDRNHLYPLTTKLPVEAQQLIDGQPAFANAVSPSQLDSGIPMPSNMGTYSYNPNGKPKKDSRNNSPSGLQGLDQTLMAFSAPNNQPNTPPISEPQSAANTLDFDFSSGMYNDFANFDGSNSYDPFELNFGGSTAGNSGQVTPNDVNWNDTDFFNYAAASD